ncbi:MAG: beta-propeller domain-containing protein [Candidatus Woesearchaeota archaeon]
MKNITKITSIVLLIVFAFSILIGCEQQITPREDKSQGRFQEFSLNLEDIQVKQINNENELKQLIQIKEVYDHMPIRGGLIAEPFFGDILMEASSMDMAKTAPTEFSTTNIQVEGIDEADMLKTDGNYIYTISNNILYIIKAFPGEEAEVIATIKYDSNPTNLFILNNKMAVFGNFNDNDYFNKIGYRPQSGITFFNIYDISDRKNPSLEQEYKFEGRYFNGRMKGDNVYLLTSMRPTINHPIPYIIENDLAIRVPIESIYYYNIDYRSPSYINTFRISLDDYSTDSTTVIVESGQNMYMSHNNIFITYTQYINEYDIQKDIVMNMIKNNLSQEDKELIERIKQTDNDILSQNEKEAKIWQIYQQHMNRLPPRENDLLQDQIESELKKRLEEIKHFEYTVINKLSIEDGKIIPTANGRVPGNIINQFSMDEDISDEVFRIATTINRRWSRFNTGMSESLNNVYALDKNLNIIGQLEGLAEGERIYSARFIGDRLYMVTFREIDPFFVIDISNPRRIIDLGELKIPGFSRYLHPYDENTIIGIGQEATDTGRITGLKISLFDVSDERNPIEIAKYVGEDRYAQSSALFEHKAFLFNKEKELLVIPIYNYDYRDQSNNYNGAMVFNIKRDSIELRGLIDHSASTSIYWSPSVERSLYIEDLLYTKSLNLLRINRIDDLSPVKNVELKGELRFPIY